MRALGFRLILCYRKPETFLEARNERLKISGNPSQYHDLDGIIREQHELYRAFCDSELEKLMLDITNTSVATAADEIVAWLEKSGGLWIADNSSERSVPSRAEATTPLNVG